MISILLWANFSGTELKIIACSSDDFELNEFYSSMELTQAERKHDVTTDRLMLLEVLQFNVISVSFRDDTLFFSFISAPGLNL